MTQKFSKTLMDFLHIYAKSLKNTLASICVAFVLSLSLVGFLQNGNSSSLLASVSNLTDVNAENTQNVADIELESTQNFFVLHLNSDIQKADFIEGILVFNPTQWLEISSENNELQKLSDGMYRFSLNFDGKMLKKWTIIARFAKNSEIEVPVTLTDTQFVSEGLRYNLSNEVK